MMTPDALATALREELDFFSDALKAQATTTKDQKAVFRNETIAERRKRISRELFEKLQGQIAHGAFAGMALDSEPTWGRSDLGSMLLGCYELEVIEALHDEEFKTKTHFVDIGAADGYYAVGCLRNGRFKTADCFEVTSAGRKTIARNAKLNQVDNRLRVFGVADKTLPSLLRDTNWSNTILLCDIEGGEFDLFDDNCLSELKGAMILIEIHNWVENFWDQYSALLQRASRHFSIRFIERSSFPQHKMPELQGMSDDNRLLLLSEGRPNVMRFIQLIS
ncbi:MAG: hypothetical protein VW774_12845 [Rhodospirillales bacterium]